MEAPGPLLSRGRDADVFELDAGRVLRRYRNGGPVALEARLMVYLTEHRYPVPRVYDAVGDDMILERVDGPTMLDDVLARPWRLARHARTLAALHERLHAIEAPTWLPERFGPGRRVLHMDLHPANVLLAARGPVVIDWRTAASGDPAADVALTALVIRAVSLPGPLLQRAAARAVARLFARRFTAASGCDPGSRLVEVARFKLQDGNVLESEARRPRRVL